jgi:hypothetical protein
LLEEVSMEDPLSLADLEVILSTHRGFADSTYIHQQLQLSYQLQLAASLLTYLPPAIFLRPYAKLTTTAAIASWVIPPCAVPSNMP